MIKIILTIVMVAIVFSGCVGIEKTKGSTMEIKYPKQVHIVKDTNIKKRKNNR